MVDQLIQIAHNYYLILSVAGLALVVAAIVNKKFRAHILKTILLIVLFIGAVVGYKLISGGHLTPKVAIHDDTRESSPGLGNRYYQDPEKKWSDQEPTP